MKFWFLTNAFYSNTILQVNEGKLLFDTFVCFHSAWKVEIKNLKSKVELYYILSTFDRRSLEMLQ